MDFVDGIEQTRLLSKTEFIALDDEEKLTYFAAQLPPFEKKILVGMISTSKDTDTTTVNVGNESNTNIYTCVANCHGDEYSDFDVSAFQYRITKLVVKKVTSLAFAIWTDLFAFLSTDQAKIMVKSGIVKMQEVNPNLDVDSTSLTYGEVDFFSFANILERANPQLGETFVDLGHGTGKGMICANLLYGKLLKKCYGVEIIPELYESSVTVLDQFRKNILCVTVDDSDSGKKEGNDDVENDTLFAAHRACDMQVALGDILVEEFIAEWASADIVFANSTCFEDSLMRQLGEIAGQRMKPGSRFISLTKQLPSSKFKLLDRRQYVMSWGEATCFTMLRVPDEAT